MSGLITPYTASCWLKGKYRSGLEMVKPNTYTVLVRYKGEVIKRHFTKHDVKLVYSAPS
jgi:hypothetical protein